MPALRDDLAGWLPVARSRLGTLRPEPRLEEHGVVVRVGDGVALVAGLPETRLDELLLFEGGAHGVAFALEPDHVGCVLLGGESWIGACSSVRGTGAVVRVPVGEALLGRVVDALGTPLDGGPAITAERLDPIERAAPAIVDREAVTRALATGVIAVDAMIPLGRGQRELIIGDRQSGKTALAVDAIINQRDSDVVCVYVAIGQKDSSVNEAIAAVRRHGRPERCVFVVGEAASPPGAQWLAPFAACTIAEFFRDRGQDALLVLDDLSRHAQIYRQLSLLLRMPPGREAYPGDIFYLHARLLERAARLATERGGGGSLTMLAVAETQAGNLSAYIPTNLISITDGQIYLDTKLFYEGQKPAVHVGRSVSRIGGRTQPPSLRRLAETLRLEYAQFLELEAFTRFGAMADERTRATLARGQRIRSLLAQPQFEPLSLGEEVALLFALAEGILDRVPLDRMEAFKKEVRARLRERTTAVLARIEENGELDEPTRTTLASALDALVTEFGGARPGKAG